MTTLPSSRFGGWTRRCNGLQQHGLKPKAFIKEDIRLPIGYGMRDVDYTESIEQRGETDV
jgi:hypothetical protein|tara:strand:- start:1006 stop:1185 length:180 start_codon:yes stop_codon:yes gene_type:complete